MVPTIPGDGFAYGNLGTSPTLPTNMFEPGAAPGPQLRNSGHLRLAEHPWLHWMALAATPGKDRKREGKARDKEPEKEKSEKSERFNRVDPTFQLLSW